MRNSIFAKPYLASNDNRSVVGIDCPTCGLHNKAIPLRTVPANQGVRIFTDRELRTKVLGNLNVSYGDPRRLPDELRGDITVTFWRCENCDLVFHREFKDWTLKQLNRQVYNVAYAKFLPNVSTDLPRYRATFLRNLFAKSIKKLSVLICESKMGQLAEELFVNGINAQSYQLFNPDFNPAGLGSFDLACMFMVLERLPDPEKTIQNILQHGREDFAILIARYPFNHKNESEHTMLSPRNGFYRMYSSKSTEIMLENLKLHYTHITPTITLAYRKLPEFAQFLNEEPVDQESLMSPTDENEEDSNTDELDKKQEREKENQRNLPSPTIIESSRIKVRKTLYGTTAYNPNDTLVGRSMENYGEYLRADQELLQQLVRPHWTVFDVAGNIGLHCLMISPLLTEGGVIHSFEPYEESFQLLGSNILLNGLKNVRTYPNAVGSEMGITRLVPTDPLNPGSMAAKGWSQQNTGYEVLLDSIDSLNPEHCDFIHITIPGCEPDVLVGADQTLQRFTPVLLVNCINVEDFKRIFALLKAHEYRMYWHIQPFFQEKNFFGNKNNIFDTAGVAKILALHSSKEQTIGLTEIKTEKDWIA